MDYAAYAAYVDYVDYVDYAPSPPRPPSHPPHAYLHYYTIRILRRLRGGGGRVVIRRLRVARDFRSQENGLAADGGCQIRVRRKAHGLGSERWACQQQRNAVERRVEYIKRMVQIWQGRMAQTWQERTQTWQERALTGGGGAGGRRDDTGARASQGVALDILAVVDCRAPAEADGGGVLSIGREKPGHLLDVGR